MDDMPGSDESAAESAPSSPANQTISEVVYFDDDGDVRIFVHDKGIQKAFIASSKAMSLLCDPWKRMFAGNFKEAQVGEDGMKEVSLPEDDPNALTILLNVAHLRFDKLPKQSLSFEGLRDLIVLSNKYYTTILLKPWIDVWSDHLRQRSGELKYEYGLEELLFVYWELGQEEGLQDLAIGLARSVEISADGKCVNKKGKVLDPDEGICYFPPGLLDSILYIRTQTIGLMLDSLYYYVDQYRTAYEEKDPKEICKSGKSQQQKRDCDSIILGSLIISMQCAGLGLERPTTGSITWSVGILAVKILGIHISKLPPGSGSEDHSCCDFFNDLYTSIEEIYNNMASPVLECHLEHAQRQMKLLRDY